MDTLHLLENKNFEELSSSEKEMVLNEISESEYRERRNILFLVKKIKEKEGFLLPNPLIKKQLAERMIVQKPLRVPIWQRSVPVWAVAASSCSVFFMSWFFMGKTNFAYPIYVEKKVVLHDTLIQKISVPSIQYLTKIEKIYIEKPNSEKNNLFLKEKKQEEFDYSQLIFEENDLLQHKGKSLAEDSLSWYLMQEVRSEILEK